MKQGNILVLKVVIFIIGMIVLGLSVFWLPSLATYTAEMYPEYAYLRFPILIGMYITAIPFILALYQAFKLLRLIESKNAFSELAVISLNHIKECAITIILFYIIGMVYLVSQNVLHPGIATIGVIIIFVAFTISLFSVVLRELLKNVLMIKSENDLIV